MNLFENSGGIAIQDTWTLANYRQACWGFRVGWIYGQRMEKGENSLRICENKKHRPALKDPRADKTSSIIHKNLKSAFYEIVLARFIVRVSGNCSKNFHNVHVREPLTNSLSFKKIPTLSDFYKLGIYGKPVSLILYFFSPWGHVHEIFPFSILESLSHPSPLFSPHISPLD